jgi:hypothetical protein
MPQTDLADPGAMPCSRRKRIGIPPTPGTAPGDSPLTQNFGGSHDRSAAAFLALGGNGLGTLGEHLSTIPGCR